MNEFLRQLIRLFANRSVRRRLVRAMPVLGVVFGALTVFQRMNTKGMRRGGLDALLDLTPFVGRLKALWELFAGDIITPARAH